MSKSSRPRREPPRGQPQAENQETYSLEEILNEFGGWSRQKPPDPPEAPAPPGEPEEPEAPAAPEKPEEPARRPPSGRFRFVEMDGAAETPAEPTPAEETQPAPAERIWTYRPEPAAETAQPPRRSRRARPEPEPEPEPEEPAGSAYPPPEDAYKSACRRTGGLLRRRRLACLLGLLAVAVTALCHLEVPLGSFRLETQLAAQILLGLLLAGCLCAYDVLVGGVYNALRLRPGLDTMLAVAAVAFAVDGFLHLGQETARLSHSAVLLVGLFFALWGRVRANRARRRSLKTVLNMGQTPKAAVLSRRAWGSRDCVLRAEGSSERYVDDLEAPTAVDRVMGVYAPASVLLTAVLAGVMAVARDRSFLTCWATMLAGALPPAAFVTYWRPFGTLAARLQKVGAALCGWRGAKLLAGPCCVVAGDTDLFGRKHVTMNGMKVFGDYSVGQVVGYTYALIAQAGCGLEPVFHEVFVNQNGRSFQLDSFRRYEGGGVGAEIQGDVVLVGSIGFMQLMGVEMPQGTNLRQAVYCAVNNRLAGVFAIHYQPASAVRSGLGTVLRCRGLSLVLATRDFVLTPAVIRHKYKVPSDAMEYPSADERARLSGPYAAVGGEQAALLGRDGFLPVAETVAGARSLYSSVWAGLCVNLLGGLLGLAITVVLCWLGAFDSASPFNLMLFCLLWTLPALLLTTVAGK